MIVTLCSFSNPIPLDRVISVEEKLKEKGVEVIRMENMDQLTTFKERADFFNRMVSQEVDVMADLSGGDLANGILPFIDYSAYKNSKTIYVGYSDCTCILNALYAETGKGGLLFHLHPENTDQFLSEVKRGRNQLEWILWKGFPDFDPEVIGGNLRCFLKLAQTGRMPSLANRILFLESHGGDLQRTLSAFCQLQQIGTDQLAGIALGQFTELDEQHKNSGQLLVWALQIAGIQAPFIVRTSQAGHSKDSKGIWIGSPLRN